MIDLIHIAEALRVDVVEESELPPAVNGMYSDHERLILIRPDLDPWNYRVCLAHELAHAYFRDEQAGDPRIERRADQWAAQLLITPAEYAAAEVMVGSSVGALAYELNVTPAVIETWRDCYRANLLDFREFSHSS